LGKGWLGERERVGVREEDVAGEGESEVRDVEGAKTSLGKSSFEGLVEVIEQEEDEEEVESHNAEIEPEGEAV
jgi:hypothetical protein